MEKEAATDVVRQFFVKICGIMFKPVSWYQHIGGNYHRYPVGMVKNSLRDFSPDAGFEYRMPEKVNPGNGFRDDLFLAGPFTVFFPSGKSFEAGRIFYDLQ
jgi:hypothetical protein